MRNPPLERTITQSIRAWLKKQAMTFFFKMPASLQKFGLPDFIGCHYGRFVALEVKRPEPAYREPTRLQQSVMCAIVEAGGYAFVVTSIQEVAFALEYVRQDQPGNSIVGPASWVRARDLRKNMNMNMNRLDLVRSKMRERMAEHNHEPGWQLVIPHEIYDQLEWAGDDMTHYFPHGYISEKTFSLLIRIRQLIDKSERK